MAEAALNVNELVPHSGEIVLIDVIDLYFFSPFYFHFCHSVKLKEIVSKYVHYTICQFFA